VTLSDRLNSGFGDFAWTARNLIAMSSLGMGSSSNHHAARFKATGDWPQLSLYLSATLALVIYTAWLAIAAAGAFTFAIPWLMQNEDPALFTPAKLLVLAMGIAAASKMIQVVYGGSLAGFGRFALLNSIEIVGDILLVGSLFTVLLLGGGLSGMAACIAGDSILRLIGKRTILHRVRPELEIWPRWKDSQRFKEIAGYGSKTFTQTLAMSILQQVTITILLYFDGAAAVALYARPRALIRFITRFVMGYSRVLVTQAGTLHGEGKHAALGKLLINGTKTAAFLGMPPAILLLVMGDEIIRIWMGPEFVRYWTLLALVTGYIPFHIQTSTQHILMGIGRHGITSLTMLLTAVISVATCYVLVGVFDLGVIGAALAVGIPVGLTNLILMPIIACRIMKIPLSRYYAQGLGQPAIAGATFAAILLTARAICPTLLVALLSGGFVGGVALGSLYWRWLPEDTRTRLLKRIPFIPKRNSSKQNPANAATTEASNPQ
jgi:O-antigen/teichoic acid export membrane protein